MLLLYILVVFSFFCPFSVVCFHKPYVAPDKCTSKCLANVNFNGTSGKQSYSSRNVPEECVFYSSTLECIKRSSNLSALSIIANDNGTNTFPLKRRSPDNGLDEYDFNYSTCGDKYFHMEVEPFIRKLPDYTPTLYFKLNLHIFTNKSMAIGLRKQCLKSGVHKDRDADNVCHNKSRPGWGAFYWPCRLFDWSNLAETYGSENLIFPLHLTYDCFRTFSAHTILKFHVILYPQMCENVYTYSLIDTLHYVAKSAADWLPLIYVDSNSDRYLNVYFNLPPAELGIYEILIQIFDFSEKRDSSSSTTGNADDAKTTMNSVNDKVPLKSEVFLIKKHTFLATFESSSSSNHEADGVNTFFSKMYSVQFTNLKKGDNYSVFVTPVTKSCSEKHRCPANHAPFSLKMDLQDITVPSSIPEATRKNSIATATFVVIALLVIGCSVSFFLLYARLQKWKRFSRMYNYHTNRCNINDNNSSCGQGPSGAANNSDHGPPILTFDRRPKVFLIYTDDSIEHRRCVARLAEYMRDNLNCDIFMDEWMLSDPGVTAKLRNEIEWVLKGISSCDFYLIVFSRGSKIVFEQPRPLFSSSIGDSVIAGSSTTVPLELKPLRPWLETFNIAITCIMEHIAEETRLDPGTKLTKIICITFDLTTANANGPSATMDSDIPELFKVLPCAKYRLLKDFSKLISHLHQLPSSYIVSPPGLDELTNQIKRTKAYYDANPDWLEHRLVPICTVDRQKILNDLELAIENMMKGCCSVLLSDSGSEEQINDSADFDNSGGSSNKNLYKSFRSQQPPSEYPLVDSEDLSSENLAALQENGLEEDAEFSLLPQDDEDSECHVKSIEEKPKLIVENKNRPPDAHLRDDVPLMILDYRQP